MLSASQQTERDDCPHKAALVADVKTAMNELFALEARDIERLMMERYRTHIEGHGC
jgi:hypothetical protein